MLKILTFCQRMNTNSSSQAQADQLSERVNAYLRGEKISFSDVKRFDITTLEQNGNVSSGGENSSFHSYDADVFLIYTLMIEKSESETGNL